MKDNLRKFAFSLKSWSWTKAVLYWLVMSAGTASECFFLIASLWVSINASVHPLVITIIPESVTIQLSQLAIAAYVALPECILALAIVTTLSHIRVYYYARSDKRALTWSILYGVPTVIFLLLSLITIGCSVLSINFQLPSFMIAIRALAGYLYGLVSLLYTQLGVPQERDRLQKKDGLLSTLRQEKDAILDGLRQEKEQIIAQSESKATELQAFIARQNEELREQKGLLEESKNAQMELIKALNKSSESALQGYSEECKTWLKSGIKTVMLDDIARFTGHAKRKIANAITSGMLQCAPRNKELILVSSLIDWLKITPASGAKVEQDTGALVAITGEVPHA